MYTENSKEVRVTGALLVSMSVVRGEGIEVGKKGVSSLTLLSGMELLWSEVRQCTGKDFIWLLCCDMLSSIRETC